jgi:hypothetical protein
MLSRDKLLTVEAQTDWAVSCYCSFFVPSCLFVPGTSSWHRLFPLFCSGVPQSTAAKDTAGVVKFEENTLPVVVFGFPYGFFRMTTATVVGRMCCFSFSQLAVAACRCWRSVLLLRDSLPTPPQATGRLLAICPDVAILLAVVALCKVILWFICLYLDGNVAEVREFENVLGPCGPRLGYQDQS